MNRSASKALLLAVAAASAGCAAKFNGQEQALSIAEEHPISVDSQTVTMTISDSSGELSALDRSRVRAFAEAYMNNGHGVVSVTAPASGGAVASVRQALYDAGVPWASMADAAYRGGEGAARDTILSYNHYVATPSACGIWEGDRERDYRNMRSPNFGCSTQNNLAAMIGDPRDLVEPADMTPPDSATRIRGVAAFRKGEVTSSETDSEVETQVSN